jgi:hypothetical protein
MTVNLLEWLKGCYVLKTKIQALRDILKLRCKLSFGDTVMDMLVDYVFAVFVN